MSYFNDPFLDHCSHCDEILLRQQAKDAEIERLRAVVREAACQVSSRHMDDGTYRIWWADSEHYTVVNAEQYAAVRRAMGDEPT